MRLLKHSGQCLPGVLVRLLAGVPFGLSSDWRRLDARREELRRHEPAGLSGGASRAAQLAVSYATGCGLSARSPVSVAPRSGRRRRGANFEDRRGCAVVGLRQLRAAVWSRPHHAAVRAVWWPVSNPVRRGAVSVTGGGARASEAQRTRGTRRAGAVELAPRWPARAGEWSCMQPIQV